jgi:zinc D-Ala-D-Ala dipeptidase
LGHKIIIMTQVFFYRAPILFLILLVISCASPKKEEKQPGTIITQIEKPQLVDSVTQPIEKQEVIEEKVNITQSPDTLEPTTTIVGDCPYESKMASQGLMDVQSVDPSILVSLKYSTTDNFVGKDVYGCLSNCFLQKAVAEKLKNASQILQKNKPNLRLLVYDGARPLAVQKILWESLPQYKPLVRKTFVADPAIGSIHNYGSAVDLTLADSAGQPLDMGTKYDFFGELAYPKFEKKYLAEGKLTEQQIENRKLLRNTMKLAGFTPIEYEWWHFNAVSRAKAKQLYGIIN